MWFQRNSGFVTQCLKYRPVVQIQTVRAFTNRAEYDVAKYATCEGFLVSNSRDNHQRGNPCQEQTTAEQPGVGMQTIFANEVDNVNFIDQKAQ